MYTFSVGFLIMAGFCLGKVDNAIENKRAFYIFAIIAFLLALVIPILGE